MANQYGDLRIIEGDPKILLIAPFGVKADIRDYSKTDQLTREIARQLGCFAIITAKKGRNTLDLSKISQAEKHMIFIPVMRKILDSTNKTLVVWMHGIKEPYRTIEQSKMRSNIGKLSLPPRVIDPRTTTRKERWDYINDNYCFPRDPNRINCLVGYGQPESLTATKKTISTFCFFLQSLLFTAYQTRNDADYFRGADADNMNQWFKQQKEYNSFDKVESFQLVFSKYCRREDNIAKTVEMVVKTLSNFYKPDELDKKIASIKKTFMTLGQSEKNVKADNELGDISAQEKLKGNNKRLPEIDNESSKGPQNREIRFLEGKNNIIAIAPHEPTTNDDNVNAIVEKLNSELGCYAVINEKYMRSDINLNDISDVIKKGIESEFLEPIKKFKDSIIKRGLSPLVVLIHGAEDVNVDTCGGEDVQILIGCGQGDNKDPKKPHRPTLSSSDYFKLEKALASVNLIPICAPTDSRYCARDKDNLNQLFKFKDWKNYYDPKVRSVQLEIRKHGFRRDPVEAGQTGEKLSRALQPFIEAENLPAKNEDTDFNSARARIFSSAISAFLEPEPENKLDEKMASIKKTLGAPLPAMTEEKADNDLVDKAFIFLKGIFVKHFEGAMLEAGRFLIQEFYGDSYDNARVGHRVRKESLNKLNERLQKEGHAPKKTWIYDAVKLAVDDHDLKDFSVYGKLGHSHKVLLTHVPEIRTKKKLASEVDKHGYTVARLRERIKEEKNENKPKFDHILTRKELENLETKELKRLKDVASNGVSRHQEQLLLYQESLKQIENVIAEKSNGNGAKTKKGGFRDWTQKGYNFNICTGCENDCLYCWAKERAYRFKQVETGKWNQPVIRQDDVEKKRKLHDGIVGFPSTHDITPFNIEAYLIVLGKFLRAGNDVLIVSKPRLECIQRICDSTQFFKDKILFRFTIGAMDDKVLSFWEPNAPKYQERKACLEFAFKNGFRTSVSMEPMLDTPSIDGLIKDLEPLVSKDIWLGTMNHLDLHQKKS